MITIVPVSLAHTKALQRMEGLFFTMGTEEQAKVVVEMSIGFSMVEGDKVLGCCGVIKMWHGVGTMWMMVSEELKKRPRLLLTTAREITMLIAVNHRFHRLELFMNPELKKHIRFIEALGFTFEGRMIKHTVDKKDHLLYAKTF